MEYPSALKMADDLIKSYPDLFTNSQQTKIVLIDAFAVYYSKMTAYNAEKEKTILNGIQNNGKDIFKAITDITRDYAKSLSNNKNFNP